MEIFHSFSEAMVHYKVAENQVIDVLITKKGVCFPVSLSYKDSRDIMFFFPGAYDNTKTKPKFQRKGYFKELSCTAISFFDPTLFLSTELISTWFQGEKDKDYIVLLEEIIQEIIVFFKIKNNRIFIFATSAGGIPAMKIAKNYSSCNVYLGNIQTDILRHRKNRIDALLKYVYEGVNIEEIRHRLHILDIDEDINVFYAQNISDKYHYDNHFEPFVKNAENTNMNCNFIIYKHEGSGHNPISSDWEKLVIQSLLSGSSLTALYKDHGYLIDSFSHKQRRVQKMQKHIIIGIRYSVLSKNLKGSWNLSKNDSFEEYKKNIFDQTRLKQREKVFEKITLPSLINLNFLMPNHINFKVHILTSEELPEENIGFLNEISQKNDFIEIKKLSVEKTDLSSDFHTFLSQEVKLGEMYASVRLDDDDALSAEWLESILNYLEPVYCDSVVSMCGGYALSIDTDLQLKKMIEWKWRFASAGLTFISKRKAIDNVSIYNCGSHTNTDSLYRTISDIKGRSFLRTYNLLNDSGNTFPAGKLVDSEKTSKILLDGFGITL